MLVVIVFHASLALSLQVSQTSLDVVVKLASPIHLLRGVLQR